MGGQGAYIRIHNKSSQTVKVKLIKGRNVEDRGLDKLSGNLKAGQQLPKEGKEMYSGGKYEYIEGEARNRLQKDGYFTLETHPTDGTTPSKITLGVDHNSWEAKESPADSDATILMVSDIDTPENGGDHYKIEIRIYDNFHPQKWMEEYGEKHRLGEKKLCQIGLPGTHDSGTYRFAKDKGTSPDTGLTKLDDLLDHGRLLGSVNSMILTQIYERMCRCQSLTIRQQLDKGIRYIDLRIGYHVESKSFLTCHGVFCVDVEEILNEINDFMEENTKEIVIVEFKKLYGLGAEENITLSKMIYKILGKKLAIQTKCPPNAPIQSYWDNGYQAVVLYQDGVTVQNSKGRLWPLQELDSPWPNVGTTKDLHVALKEKVAGRNPHKFFCAQGILTPDAEVVKREIMSGDGLSIKQLSKQCAGKVVDWVEDEWKPSDQLNIVIVDFTETSNLIPSVINYNTHA